MGAREDGRFARVIAAMHAAVLIEDGARRVVLTNTAFVELFGLPHTPKELVGVDVVMLAAESKHVFIDPGAFITEMTGTVAVAEPVPWSEVRLADGRIVEREYTPIRTGNRVEGHLWQFRDVTERRRLERALAQARDEALEASRLKSEFLAVMSHEIRTPMYGVTGAVDLLAEQELDDEQRELVDILEESSQSLLSLIDEILDFSKIEAGRVELDVAELDPAATVESATEVFAGEARRRGLSLMSVVAPGVPAAILGDAGRLRQVVVNLVGNAVKFTDAGEIIVRLDAPDAGAVLRIEVTDSGPGIAPEVQRTLFDPFTQGDPSSRRAHDGTGLGLAICERLVGLMGGTIAVASPPDGGTRMCVDLPVRAVAGARASWEPPALLRGRTAGVALSSPRLAAAMRDALLGLGLVVPDSVEPGGVDVWVAEVTSSAAVPSGATLAVLGEDERGTGPLPVRRTRLAEVLVHALMGAPPPAPPGSEPAADAAPALPASGRVLVAEDNAVNRTLALRQLARLGLGADGVASGPEAIEALRRRRYDAVLMDRRMPGMDGLDATRAIRELERGGDRRTPIIAVTADARPDDRDVCLAAGMDDYLTKPLALDDLRRVLAAWLPARPPPDPTEPADADALHRLVSDLGSPAPVAELVALWLGELPERRTAVAAALAAADERAVQAATHLLSSTSRLLGGDAAADVAGAIEAAARGGELGAATARLGELEHALDALENHLRGWLAAVEHGLSEP
jgi:two-component system sensor histidine kinase/response regulator